MSKPVKVAFVMEGSTDYVVLRAAVRALLKGRDFEPTSVWPELDANLRPMAEGGWGAVYKWCRQLLKQGDGPARDNPVFAMNDMVVIQVDADVARMKYEEYGIKDPPDDELFRRTCEKACPPSSHTTNALRAVMVGWMGETTVPPKAVLSTPSKSIETWVLVALFPDDADAKSPKIECWWGAEPRLRKYGLIKSGQKLIDKYRANEKGIQDAWPDVRAKCTEADRFSTAFLALVPAE